jgi:hypothetical protein
VAYDHETARPGRPEYPRLTPQEPNVEAVAHVLADRSFVHLTRTWPDPAAAWTCALAVFAATQKIDPLDGGLPELTVVGEYLVPPPGAIQRPFQALHLDFGLPLGTGQRVDVARFTALFADPARGGSGAVTRVVPLVPLLAQRSWPDRSVIADRLARTASPDRSVEGILGRIIEIADQDSSLTPLDTPGFLCGMEFSSLADEHSYFAQNGVPLETVQQPITLGPGELLMMDNLRTAHGRNGQRNPQELHQLFVGYPSLDRRRQRLLLDCVLAAFIS